MLNNSNSPPATAVARPSSPPKTDLKSEPPLPQKLVLEPGISGSLKSLQISPDNSATLDDVIEAAKQLKVTNQPPQESRRRRAVTALPSTVIRPIKISPSEETKIMEDENADQPTRLMSLTKRLNSPPRSYSKFEKADDTNNLTSSPSAAISVISSDHSNSGEMAILARRLSMVGQPAEDNSETSKMDGLTAKLKLENFDIKDVIAWHEIHKPPKMIRTVKFGFRRGTSSTLLDTATMFQDVHKALMALPECQSKKLKYKRHPDYYNFSCTYSEDGVKDLLKFDVEICRVWLLDVHACKTFNVICSEDEKAGWRGNVI